MKIAIIGAGTMGGATALGLAKSGKVDVSSISISNPSRGKLDNLQALLPELHIHQHNSQCVKDADIVILATKPWKIAEVIANIQAELKPGVILVSYAAGVTLADLRHMIGDSTPLFYVIPNTAMTYCQSMTFIAQDGASQAQQDIITNLFKTVGDVLPVEERLIPAGMALASCGIAYAMRYVRAATEGGVQLGMYARDAQRIVQQTLLGAVAVLQATGDHPEAQIDRVCTPGGFTIRGLNTMEENGFTNAVIQGLLASSKK